ncbi:hypothetical protein LINPERHAP1_LOCUS22049 [Linum perenne]
MVSSALDRRISTAAPTTLSSASDVAPQFTPPTSSSLAMSVSLSAGTEAPLRGTPSPALDLAPIHLPAPPALPRRLTLCPAPLHPHLPTFTPLTRSAPVRHPSTAPFIVEARRRRNCGDPETCLCIWNSDSASRIEAVLLRLESSATRLNASETLDALRKINEWGSKSERNRVYIVSAGAVSTLVNFLKPNTIGESPEMYRRSTTLSRSCSFLLLPGVEEQWEITAAGIGDAGRVRRSRRRESET